MNVALARLLRTAIALACCLPVAGPVLAQADKYPSRPVAFVLPASAGGASDTIARTMAQKLSEIWGSPVIVENKPGGGGAIATEYVAKSKPDGYTLLMVSLAIYVAAIAWLGFFASTFAYATLLMTRLGVRLWAAAAVTLCMLLAVYWLFVVQFRVVLPAGPWGL